MGNFKRKYQAEHLLQFQVDLRGYGKTSADIVDIQFSIKVDPENDADNSLFLKTYTNNGGITYTGTDVLVISIEWASTEYTSLAKHTSYKCALGMKWSGETVIDENFSQDFNVEIIGDHFRN